MAGDGAGAEIRDRCGAEVRASNKSPQEHLLEAPFLRSWEFTVFFFITKASTLTLEWSPIQVLTKSQLQ